MEKFESPVLQNGDIVHINSLIMVDDVQIFRVTSLSLRKNKNTNFFFSTDEKHEKWIELNEEHHKFEIVGEMYQ